MLVSLTVDANDKPHTHAYEVLSCSESSFMHHESCVVLQINIAMCTAGLQIKAGEADGRCQR